MSDDAQRGPCSECGEQIAVQADECNHCGHNPGQEQYYGPLFCTMFGALLSILIITAVIGIPLMFVGIVWGVWVWQTAETPRPIDESRLEDVAV